MDKYFNTKDLIDNLTDKNRAFIKRVSKKQEEKYGNVDIFSASVKGNEVEICFGDYFITFYFRRDCSISDTYGSGQGHRFHTALERCAVELYKKYGGDYHV